MEVLLEEFYRNDLHADKFRARKAQIDNQSYQINGISQSGKTFLVKNYLLDMKKNSYLYIDCMDIRIDINALNAHLKEFCVQKEIKILVLDNYTLDIKLINISQLIIVSEIFIQTDFLKQIELFPLDYEEFLAHEHKYDSSALNHFIQLGGFPYMHNVSLENRSIYIQKMLKNTLDNIEFDILVFCAKNTSQKISPHSIYERLKQSRKISKDKLYKSYEAILNKRYIHELKKLNHHKAIKKIYLCDTSLKSSLSISKNFGKLFENIVFLELLKLKIECYYEDNIDFYLPKSEEIILCVPFADERSLFKKIEQIESFIFSYQISKVTIITMNSEREIAHPLSKIEMLPFDIWAIGD